MKRNFKSILVLVVVIIAVLIGVSVFAGNLTNSDELTYSKLISLFEDDLVQSFEVDGKLVLHLNVLDAERDSTGEYLRDPATGKVIVKNDKNGKPIYIPYTVKLSYSFQLEQINELAYEKFLEQDSNLTDYNYEKAAETPWYQIFLPYIIIAVLFIGLWIFLARQAPGGGKMNSFSRSKAKVNLNDRDPIKFADVAGADEEKAELEEVVEFLKDPAKFVKLGARIPRGVLLVGPPGTGKTLLAKAVAGEAGVPFFSISGSDFVEMYVGVGASRVRDLFESARRTPASIIFIDEIDAVGRHRGAGLGGGHDEREQTLNQLLVEMDGFGTNSGVIVMAATNRPDILDPALLRPGRFDRRVTVNYPDMNGREAILKVHCRNKPLERTVDLRKIAQTTIGFTGADLANLMNEAALLAAKKNKALIGMEDIEDSYMKMLLGPQKKSKVRTEKDNKLCAYHEAGHAIAAYYCENTDPIKHITIIPAGSAGGVTIAVPTEDRLGESRNQMIDNIVFSLGGRAAEEIALDDISTGASQDIQQATRVAKAMVTRYGMSEKLGTVLYGSEHSSDEVFLGRSFSSGKDYSEKTAAVIDDEVRAIIFGAYEKCKAILSTHIDKLHFVASFLLKNESMDDEQFRAAMESDSPTIEEIEAIASDKKNRSDEENRSQHERNARAEQEERERAARESERMANDAFGASSGGFSSEDFFANVWNPNGSSNTSSGSSNNESNNDSNNTDSTDNNE